MTFIKSKLIERPLANRGTAVLSLVVIIFIFLTGLLYVFQTNSAVGQIYQIRQQKEYLQKLILSNQKLQIEAAQLQSPANLEKIAEQLKMTAVKEIVYLEKNGAVAVKK